MDSSYSSRMGLGAGEGTVKNEHKHNEVVSAVEGSTLEMLKPLPHRRLLSYSE